MTQMTPLEKLCQIPDIQDAIDAIASDLESGDRQFADIDTWDLADALGVQLDGPGASCMNVISRFSLDDSSDEFPARDMLKLLREHVSAERYAELMAEGEAIDAFARASDLNLQPDERQLLEVAIARQAMADGSGWQVNRHTLYATKGGRSALRSLKETLASSLILLGLIKSTTRDGPSSMG